MGKISAWYDNEWGFSNRMCDIAEKKQDQIMKSIENIENIENKIVILRLDLNVPIKNGKITDTNRIDKVMPTLQFLLKKKAKIVIISHVGRPKGKIVKELSLELVSLYIKNKIKKEVSLLKENIFNLNKEEIFKNSNDELLL